MNLNGDFAALINEPAIQGRIDYLTKYLKNASSNNSQLYTLTLALFSLFIENVSLFSQFLVIKAFNKEKNILKDVDNVIGATQREENLHAMFGAYLINEVKNEFPEWFNDDFYKKIERACKKAYLAEMEIIYWMFSKGEIDILPVDVIDEFIKHRFNESMTMIGARAIFPVNEEKLEKVAWYIEELNLQVQPDFFWKKSNNYSKNMQSVTADDLF